MELGRPADPAPPARLGVPRPDQGGDRRGVRAFHHDLHHGPDGGQDLLRQDEALPRRGRRQRLLPLFGNREVRRAGEPRLIPAGHPAHRDRGRGCEGRRRVHRHDPLRRHRDILGADQGRMAVQRPARDDERHVEGPVERRAGMVEQPDRVAQGPGTGNVVREGQEVPWGHVHRLHGRQALRHTHRIRGGRREVRTRLRGERD